MRLDFLSFTSCREGFTTSAYLDALGKARIDAERPPPREGPMTAPGTDASPNADTDAGGQPGLQAALRQWRARKAQEEERHGDTRYRILTRAVLRQIAETLPGSKVALTAVKGIGKHTVARYGEEILAIVADYRQGRENEAAAGARPERQRQAKAQEIDTKLISYRLYQEGSSVESIAELRSLKPTTIEGHLAHYVGTGELPISDFVGNEKIARIAAVLEEMGDDELGPAKQALGDDCSYGEIKMVRAHLRRKG